MKSSPRNQHTPSKHQSGFGMVEVLVSLVILLIGLLGLAGLMMHGQRAEMESYQRVQALVLLQDMVGRINANRKVASCYVLAGTAYLGTSKTASTTSGCGGGSANQNAQVDLDLAAWNALLQGAAEGGVGAMIGARGCISYNAASEVNNPTTGAAIAGTGVYTIEVAWQGLGKTFANTTSLCAQNQYGSELQRRVAPLTLRIASMI